jgi:hypothetical protein
VDFYGDGRSVYAFVIERYYGYGGKVDGKLVIAEKKRYRVGIKHTGRR